MLQRNLLVVRGKQSEVGAEGAKTGARFRGTRGRVFGGIGRGGAGRVGGSVRDDLAAAQRHAGQVVAVAAGQEAVLG